MLLLKCDDEANRPDEAKLALGEKWCLVWPATPRRCLGPSRYSKLNEFKLVD